MDYSSQSLSTLSSRSRNFTARELCIDVPYVTPESDNLTVMELFTQHKSLISLPVVEDKRPFGMINRHIFLSQMARPFFRELYDRKSCIAFMDKFPLVIDSESTLDVVARQMVASGDKSVTDGFILTAGDEYTGMGLGIDVIKTVSDLQARQHHQIMQSIEYARVIQEAMLEHSRQTLAADLNDWCLTWQPRDCVGGDFYAFHQVDNGWLMLLADCTGHGVPGAFMTVILSSALEKALGKCPPDRPDRLLQHINHAIKQTLGQLNQSQQTSMSNDGCDAMAVFINKSQQKLRWAGARISGFLLSGVSEQAIALSSDRMGVGYTDTPVDYCWTLHELPLKPQDLFFSFTDGLTDQIGGERNIMFGKCRIQALLEQHRTRPMPELSAALMDAWQAWQGSQQRRDDMTFLGFRF
ncbi:SpoIIE family protein phosphatase [Erwinia amylovora]